MSFTIVILVNCMFTMVYCWIPPLAHPYERSTDLFTILESSTDFKEDLLPELSTQDFTAEITDIAEAPGGGFYVTGSIEAVSEDTSDSPLMTNEANDQLGELDIFLMKLQSDGQHDWGRRFGSAGQDAARAIAVDPDDNVYVVGSVGKSVGEHTAGAAIFKYSGNGTRQWVKTMGNKAAQDSLNGVALSEDASEVIAAGTIGSGSSLHTDETRTDGFAVLILRISSLTGEILEMGVTGKREGIEGNLGNALAVSLAEGNGTCFVAGYSIGQSGTSTVTYASVFSFEYPSLAAVIDQQVGTDSIQSFLSIAISLNGQAVFAVGVRDVSSYEEDNALVFGLDASDLSSLWATEVGSIEFPDQASVVTGAASEKAQDVLVDDYGNIYVLFEASGSIVSEDAQDGLTNKRAALFVFAPNGTLLYRVQSSRTQTTGPTCMVAKQGRVLIGGWTVDETTSLSRPYVSGISLPQTVYRNHGSEYVRPEENNVGDTNKDDDSSDLDSTTNSKTGVIIGAVGGGVAGLLVIVGIAIGALRMRSARANRDAA